MPEPDAAALHRAQCFLSFLAPGAGGHGFDNQHMPSLNILAAAPGYVLCSFPVATGAQNNHGSLHGGCIATLVDVVGSLAIATVADVAHVSLAIQTHYHQAIRGGSTIAVEAQVVKQGSRIASTQVDFWELQPTRTAATAVASNSPQGSSSRHSSSLIKGSIPASSLPAAAAAGSSAVARRRLLAQGTHVKVLQPSTNFDQLFQLPGAAAAAAAGRKVAGVQREEAAAAVQQQAARLAGLIQQQQLPIPMGVYVPQAAGGVSNAVPSSGTGCCVGSHNPERCGNSCCHSAATATACCGSSCCQCCCSSSSETLVRAPVYLKGLQVSARSSADVEAHRRADLFLHSTIGIGARFDAAALSGGQLLGAQPGRVWVLLLVGGDVINTYGTLHGGCTATLVDVLGTAALVTTSDSGGVSLSLECHYLRGVPVGSLVLVDAQVVKAGGSIATMEVALYMLANRSGSSSTSSNNSSSSRHQGGGSRSGLQQVPGQGGRTAAAANRSRPGSAAAAASGVPSAAELATAALTAARGSASTGLTAARGSQQASGLSATSSSGGSSSSNSVEWQLAATGTLVKSLSSGLVPAGNLTWLWPLRREEVQAALKERRQQHQHQQQQQQLLTPRRPPRGRL